MAKTLTTNYALGNWEDGDNPGADDLNTNWQTIDEQVWNREREILTLDADVLVDLASLGDGRISHKRVNTTDATVTTIDTITIPAATTVGLEVHVRARRTGGASGTAEDGAYYVRHLAYKNVAGTATIIGAAAATATIEDQAGWDVTFVVTTNTVAVRVTGAAGNEITWTSTVKMRTT